MLKMLAVFVIIAATAWLVLRSLHPGFSLQAPAQSAVGAEFTVTLMLNSGDYTVTAADLSFAYDPRVLELMSLDPGGLLPSVLKPVRIGGDGHASAAFGSGISPNPGPGTIAILRFRALTPGTAIITVEPLSQAAASGHAGNILPRIPPVSVRVR